MSIESSAIVPGFKLTFGDESNPLLIDGLGCTRIVHPALGPPVIQHPAIRAGRPTSYLDVLYVRETGERLYAHQRVIPCDRDFTDGGARIVKGDLALHQFEVYDPLVYHREVMLLERGRGRPSSFCSYNLDTLREWRDNIFAGLLTIRDLAKLIKVAETSAHRFAHGETLWYV